ncbi:MAG: rhamnulokinase, partial [Proteobacteria bacterium]|nr:rhamnulokinase [Pseudomonadota bacterium]
EEVYTRTGIQFMQFNSLFQLYASYLEDPSILEKAETFLMIPDYLNYRLTHIKATEYTIASTTQLWNIADSQWDEALIDLLNVKPSLFLHPRDPGTVLGDMDSTVGEQTGITGATIVLPGTHDTASAVAAIPVSKPDNWAYISSGTWSLMGIETDKPILSPKALNYNFTNEGGVNNTVRFLKNIMGLWPIQEMQRQFGGKYTIEDIITQARQATPFEFLIDPEDPVFLAPGDMLERIAGFCRRTGQPAPDGIGQLARCVFDSLSLRYRQVLNELNDINGEKIDRIHIVGGGSRNRLLNQLCADVTGCEVFAGPTEVTSLGNLLLQFVANGDIASIQEGRRIIRESFEIERYEPKTVPGLDERYERFLSLRQNEP